MKNIKKPFQHERIHRSIHSKPKRDKNDKFILGLILGMITPILGMLLVWVLMFSDIALKYILRWFVAFENPRVLNEIRSEEHTSELQSRGHLVCRLLLEKKKTI